MTGVLRSVASKLGVDKAIFFTTSGNVLGTVGSIVSVFLVIKYLTGVEQGFYYTFGSIVAIQVFFELGLNGIITQYVAHEASNLTWKNDQVIAGDSKFMSRLSSLLHFSVKWYLTFASVLLISLVAIGIIFFGKYDTTGGTVIWKTPWLILAIGTTINLILSPVTAFLQGLGKVKEMAQIQFIVLIFRFMIIWGGLILGAKMLVLGLSSIAGATILLLLSTIKYKKLLSDIWLIKIVEKVHYRKEIFPYQWKIGISWISGYFIFQLFNPVLFASDGPIVAGQMGMTLAALNGILTFSMAWISTKVPLFSSLIAQKNYSQLDSVFNKALKQSSLINFAALCSMAAAIFLIRFYNLEIFGKLLGIRFLNYVPMFLMMIPVFLNLIVSSWATYLRCHKKEPFLINSVVAGILCSLSTLLLGKNFGVLGITSGYCLITIAIFPWAYFIYKTKKQEWHKL